MLELPRFAPDLRPLLLVGGSLVAGLLAERLLRPALARMVKRTPFRWDDVFVDGLRGLLWIWLVLAGLLVATPDLNLLPEVEARVRFFCVLAYIVTVTIFAARFIGNLVRVLSGRGLVTSSSILRNVARLVVYVVGGVVVLDRLGIAIAPILTVLGLGGLCISLALKDTLSNLFAGMEIVASGHVRVGDWVKLDSGDEGTIADIQWRATTVRTSANTLVVVPNAKMAESLVTNYSRPTSEIMVRVPFAVGYGVDLDRIERIAIEVGRETLKESPAAVADFEPIVRFGALSESSIALTLILRAREPGQEGVLRHEAVKRLHRRLAAEGVEAPYPVRSVRWTGGEPPAEKT
jgi:small-conductance mechanosensitive channel